MMSVHGSSVTRLNSRGSISSASRLTLCHVCGDEFPKNALPSHQRGCIRKSMGLRRSVTLSASSTSTRRSVSLGNEISRFTGMEVAEHRVSNEFIKPSALNTKLRREKTFHPQDSVKTLISDDEIVPNVRVRPEFSKAMETLSLNEDKRSKSRNERASVELLIAKKKSTPEYNAEKELHYDQDEFEEEVPLPPVANYHENEEEEQLDVSAYLVPCTICSRKFMSDRLERHRVVCQKSNSKQRKVFDMRAARVQGTELEKYVLKKPSGPEPVVRIGNKVKKSNWRSKHMAFQQMVAAAKNPDIAPPAPIINPDYISCPTCDRRFNEESGKRHIPICKEKAQKKQMVSGNSNKGDNLKRRTAYKPPSPRKANK